MNVNGVRRRHGNGTQAKGSMPMGQVEEQMTDDGKEDSNIPKYTIDLSLEPAERYKHVALDFKQQAAELPCLFDELVQECVPTKLVSKVRHLARFTLRGVYGREENEELRGISQVTGIEMWLLVAFNVLLDLFMGCTSGGVRVNHDEATSRMLHFRTLDWGMDPLRKMIVHLEFVEKPGSKIIASSLGYFGYVGVLTGVRKGLSMSLNFRPNHNENGRVGNYRFYFHILLVLLGFRPSISSLLRHCLLPPSNTSTNALFEARTITSIEQTLPGVTTTAAYLSFSDGDRTVIMEKDRSMALTRSADDFITVTNHDSAEENVASSPSVAQSGLNPLQKMGMAKIVEESISRKDTVVQLWEKTLGQGEGKTSKRAQKRRQTLNAEKIARWVKKYPITNEETHFAVLMDPKVGRVVWARRHLEPVESN